MQQPVDSLLPVAPPTPAPRPVALLMAGGQGARLWPLSRPDQPKQFVPLLHPTRTLLQQTCARLEGVVAAADTFVLVNDGMLAAARAQLPALPAVNFIATPTNRDTLPALVLAAAVIEARCPGATLLVLAADAHVDDDVALRAAFATMLRAAAAGPHLVSLGIRPTAPNCAYGYMRRGAPAPFGPQTSFGLGYVEKPDAARAAQLVADGQHDWNSGMFAWQAAVFLAACGAVDPGLVAPLQALQRAVAAGDAAAPDAVAAAFARLPRTSVDHGLLEKVTEPAGEGALRHVFVSGTFGWDDVGSFAALGRLLPADAAGTGCRGAVTARDTAGSLLLAAPGRRLEVVGGRDLLVVLGAGGEVLVADRGRHAEVAAVAAGPLSHGVVALGTPPLQVLEDADGNRLAGPCRLRDVRGCEVVVAADSDAVVALLGVRGVTVRVDSDAVRVTAGAAVPVAPARPARPARPLPEATVLASAEEVAAAVAQCLVADIEAALGRRLFVAVVLSAGRTPQRAYEILATAHRHALPWERVHLFQMDEYSGLPDADPRRFRAFLEAALVRPLGMRPHFLHGAETAAQMRAHADAIAALGGLAVVLHGIGRNGHLGFNEPGYDPSLRGGRVPLAATTLADLAAASPPGAPVPRGGVTLGLAVLNAAASVRVVATGAAKAAALRRGLTAPAAADSALSSLVGHPDVRYFADLMAAAGLRR